VNAPRALWPKTLRHRGILYRVHEGRPEWRDDDRNAWHPVPLVSLAVVAEPHEAIWIWLGAHGIERPTWP
jgi:hypothetical protein